MEKISVTVPEAVQMTGIARTMLYAAFKEGKLVPRKYGRRTVILVEDLRRFIESLPRRAY
jgi:predicted DNA-binding transcriptional regulator AlpA